MDPDLDVVLTFVDNGPGIADIEMALRDGFTTGTGLGLGLGGSKRLVNEFGIESKVGQGTKVVVNTLEIGLKADDHPSN